MLIASTQYSAKNSTEATEITIILAMLRLHKRLFLLCNRFSPWPACMYYKVTVVVLLSLGHVTDVLCLGHSTHFT